MMSQVIVSLYHAVTVFLYPVLLVCLLLLLGFLLKQRKWRQGIICSAFIILYGVASGFLVQPFLLHMIPYTTVSLDTIKKHHALILLGGGLNCKKTVCQKSDARPKTLAYSRIFEAYRIYRAAKALNIRYRIIASGGDPEHYGVSEAAVYADMLKHMGVSSHDLVLEDKSLNTYQNAERTRDLLDHHASQSYLLVTSGIHMRRALFYFRHFGISVYPAPSDIPKCRESWRPMAYNLSLFEFCLSELIGIGRLYVYDWLGLNKPSFNH